MYSIVELSSTDKVIKNSSIASISLLPYHLSSNTTKVNISSGYQDYVQFIVGRCKHNGIGILENSYVLDHNGTWFLTCASTNEMFKANCYSNGSWNHIPCEGSGTNMTTSMPTVINGSIIITTMKSNRDNASTLHVNHFEDHEVNSTITTSNSSLVIILTATIIPVILVLVLLSTVMILVITWNLGHKNRGNHIESCDLEDDENMTYQQLNHPRPNVPHTGQQLHVQSNSDGDYSSLKHMKFTLPHITTYDTIQGEQRKKATRKIDYTEIHTCSHCGQVKPFEDDKVQYSNIHYQMEKSDELLNLKTLMAQLGPISESFVAFGSVAGISLASLNDIGAKSSSSYHSMTEVCDLWLQKCRQEQSPPTWHTVAEILEIIGHNKLSKKILQVYTTGKLPVPVEITLPEIAIDPPVTSTSTSTKLTESEITLMECEEIQADNELDAASVNEEPPPIPPFNPQCVNEPENMPPPFCEDMQVIALRPLASDGTQHQSGSEESAATFTVL